MSAPVHGMRGKRNAAKHDAEKVTGKGQIMLYAGDLKAKVQAALAPRQSVSDWVREAIREKLERLN